MGWSSAIRNLEFPNFHRIETGKGLDLGIMVFNPPNERGVTKRGGGVGGDVGLLVIGIELGLLFFDGGRWWMEMERRGIDRAR